MITLNDISILIVSRVNDPLRLKLVYDRIRQFYPITEIVIIYDYINHSLNVVDDNLIEFVSNERVYVSKGYNLALKLATKKAFVFLHDDTFIHSNFLDNLINHIKEDVLCNFITVEPPMFGNTFVRERPISNFGYNLDELNLDMFNSYCDTLIKQTVIETKDNPDGGFFMAGYIKTLLNLGGFDENFIPYFYEDSDLILRLHLNNIKFIFVYNSFVYHLVSLTSRHSEDSNIAQQTTEQIFIKKWGSSFNTIKEFTIRQHIKLNYYYIKLNYSNIDINLLNYLLNYFNNDIDNVEYSTLTIDGLKLTRDDLKYIDYLRYIITDNINSLKSNDVYYLGSMKLELNINNEIKKIV